MVVRAWLGIAIAAYSLLTGPFAHLHRAECASNGGSFHFHLEPVGTAAAPIIDDHQEPVDIDPSADHQERAPAALLEAASLPAPPVEAASSVTLPDHSSPFDSPGGPPLPPRAPPV